MISPADEYAAACAAIDSQAVTIALLLEQVTELEAIVDAVKNLRTEIGDNEAAASRLWKAAEDRLDRGWLEALQWVGGQLDQVDGL